VTHESFAALVGRAGLGFHGLPVDPRAELLTEHGRRLLRSRSGPAKMARRVMRRMSHGMLEAARESDILLLSASVAPLGRVVADGLGLPSRGVYLRPIAPTGEFPPSVLGARSWGPAANRVAGRLVDAALDAAFAESTRMLRGELGVARDRAGGRRARGRPDWPVRHGFSPLVVPRPGTGIRGSPSAGTGGRTIRRRSNSRSGSVTSWTPDPPRSSSGWAARPWKTPSG
jgi:hypothetical protein